MNMGYWVSTILCVSSMIMYAVTNSRKFLALAYGTIVFYALLMGIGSGLI